MTCSINIIKIIKTIALQGLLAYELLSALYGNVMPEATRS